MRVTNWNGFGNERSRPNKTRVIVSRHFLGMKKITTDLSHGVVSLPSFEPGTSKTNSLVAFVVLKHTFYTLQSVAQGCTTTVLQLVAGFFRT